MRTSEPTRPGIPGSRWRAPRNDKRRYGGHAAEPDACYGSIAASCSAVRISFGNSTFCTCLSSARAGLVLAFYALVTVWAFAVYCRRHEPAAFVLALLSLAACLVQVESGIIFSIFVKQYHNYAVFYALFLSLLGAQAIGQVAWAHSSRIRHKMVVPAQL